jgi:hypothetical protein
MSAGRELACTLQGAVPGFVAPNIKSWADASVGPKNTELYVIGCTTLLGRLHSCYP